MAWHGMARHGHGGRCTRQGMHGKRLRLCSVHDAHGIALGMPCRAMPTCARRRGC